MEKVEWKNDYCIGVEEIDVQHRKLLSIVNEFYDVAVGHPADYPIKVGRCLKKLTDYTHYHFEAEEMLMERLINRGKTSGRADDNAETIKKRLDVYHNQTTPLIEWYEKEGQRHKVKGFGSLEEINDALCAVIDTL